MTPSDLLNETRGRAHVPAKPERPLWQGSDRRISILLAALELFAVQGFRYTTMADLGDHVGIKGPSIYGHFASKQEILSEIMSATMDRLLGEFQSAVESTDDVVEQLRRSVEAHVRYHARHRFEAFVGTREIGSLREPERSTITARRDEYERGFRSLIEQGVAAERLSVSSPRLASYAILDMGMGVAVWFREDGPLGEDQVVREYGIMALHAVGAA